MGDFWNEASAGTLINVKSWGGGGGGGGQGQVTRKFDTVKLYQWTRLLFDL